uniref:P5 n=1 Tax=Tomato chlorosis virus TaxID=67754 RepID=A0A218MIY8_9CLOS|nr:P5 protein [Tomato chlorosis virus]AXF74712.1 P5 [Tomato chlorosis virus]
MSEHFVCDSLDDMAKDIHSMYILFFYTILVGVLLTFVASCVKGVLEVRRVN